MERIPEYITAVYGRGHSTRYLVKWQGLSSKENSWVSYKDMKDHAGVVNAFRKEQLKRHVNNYAARRRQDLDDENEDNVSEVNSSRSIDSQSSFASEVKKDESPKSFRENAPIVLDPKPQPKPKSREEALAPYIAFQIAKSPKVLDHVVVNQRIMCRVKIDKAYYNRELEDIYFPAKVIEDINPAIFHEYMANIKTD